MHKRQKATLPDRRARGEKILPLQRQFYFEFREKLLILARQKH